MITLSKLNKTYGSQRVVNEASMAFEQGKITAIIGPNGAGKSTLLSMASRLTKLDDGAIRIANVALQDWDNAELAKTLSVLRQANNVNMRFSVRELVAFGRFPHSQGRLTPEDENKIDDALAKLDLTLLQHKYLDQLSGGQRQMAFIAMVVAQDTEYVFLDEPLNNLDIKHSVEIMQVLRRLAHDFGKAVVIVIHDINFAASYADNLVAMKQGKVVCQGSVAEVLTEQQMSQIYDIPFAIHDIGDKKVCVYFG
ncbi:iron ABC transporter ATP-binding protein [Motilimonas pumila]|uniref:ATP-binding cassette domain-containing protein n=1 Tax=Motilimonas pumila TaxID=2303987 RepID=A0A418YB50_9GAMM|nr:ATP-binding cassette domain-containing protein [Motilimonas pumila]RJG40195.1 ATP-binding cassette domain-containing protein [Motilimonas pumila]